MNYKVFIPTAGIGSRVGENFNKALLSVSHRPAICHIIDKFPQNIEIVIALGYCGNYVKQVLDLLYPNRKITYCEISPYEGKDSGLGLTFLQSKHELQCPFVFCSCDTVVLEAIPAPSENWMGYASKESTGFKQLPISDRYRSLKIKGKPEYVTEICSKNAKGDYPYIGLAGIYDYELFWQKMEEGQDIGSIEIGESFGLKYLLCNKIRAKKFTWYDTGNKASLEKTRKKFYSPIKANILPKKDEAIWFVHIDSPHRSVVKFAVDYKFIEDRVKRANDYLDGYIPCVESSTPNTYTYKMQQGEILSNIVNTDNFALLLNHLKNFWQVLELGNNDKQTFNETCSQFYRDKTNERVKKYLKTFEQIDQQEIINGIEVPTINEILSQLDWTWICDGLPSERFHGDLHFENILFDNQNFVFLDWRQNFGGLLEYGDIYYDLAKLNHGIIISHEIIDKNLFSHSISNNIITFDFLRKNISIELERILERFIILEGYHYKKVQYLTNLIFLNIAALHHYPYGLLLFHLGKLGLWRLLQENNDKN